MTDIFLKERLRYPGMTTEEKQRPLSLKSHDSGAKDQY